MSGRQGKNYRIPCTLCGAPVGESCSDPSEEQRARRIAGCDERWAGLPRQRRHATRDPELVAGALEVARILIVRPVYGITACQVCVTQDATDDEILEFCDEANPSGTYEGWTTVIRSGDLGPVTCFGDPKRLHIIVEC